MFLKPSSTISVSQEKAASSCCWVWVPGEMRRQEVKYVYELNQAFPNKCRQPRSRRCSCHLMTWTPPAESDIKGPQPAPLLRQLPAVQTALSALLQWTREHTRGGGGVRQTGRERRCVSVRGRGHSLSSKELHAQQSEDHDEEEEEEQQADDGLHWIKEGDYEVPQRVPVSGKKQQNQMRVPHIPEATKMSDGM